MSTGDLRHGTWSLEEVNSLTNAVKYYGVKNWKLIAEQVTGRTPKQCQYRWASTMRPDLIKGPWSAHEDKKLQKWVKNEGPVRWNHCAELIKGRSPKQCRERWTNFLNPEVKKSLWSNEEDAKILQMYNEYGPKWIKIAEGLPGRSMNSIKNRFYSVIRKMENQKECKPKERENPLGLYCEARMTSLINQVQEMESILSRTREEILTLKNSFQSDDRTKYCNLKIEEEHPNLCGFK